ncbi:hypothetical protein E2I00_004238, partial [Balaenoptera physalus]
RTRNQEVRRVSVLSTLKFLSMESADNKQCNSTKKAEEEYMSCKFQLTSLKLSTKGLKLDGYKGLCEHAYPHQKNIPATAEEARILSPSRRKSKLDKAELLLECSDKQMSLEGAAPPEEGAPAPEGAPTLQGVVSTSAPDQEAVFASWSRMTARAVKMESVQSQETCGVWWSVVHGRGLPADIEGWVHLQFHTGQAWVPDKLRRVNALFLLPASNFPHLHTWRTICCALSVYTGIKY